MNLYNDNTLASLRQLLNDADPKLIVHNIVLDYDGEVIVDPEFKFSGIGINRYKYHVQISHSVKDNIICLRNLLENLRNSFDMGIQRLYAENKNQKSAA